MPLTSKHFIRMTSRNGWLWRNGTCRRRCLCYNTLPKTNVDTQPYASGIQSYSQTLIGVSNHLFCRFQYCSQVIGFEGRKWWFGKRWLRSKNGTFLGINVEIWGIARNSASLFFWKLVVSTPLRNLSQHGNLPQIGVKIKHIWNHHPVLGTGYFFVLSSNWLRNRKG